MTDTETSYQVLARKYRPDTFRDLVGQDAMVRTLKNAFEADRIAHAFIMTGIRGTGKTTTARIIAKGLNCVGADGKGGPTIEPCGQCEPCVAIAEGRHVDVLEMDAASRTGVADIREIIDSVQYRAASARYKVYIIDEVHMLSTNAFNALLKTLEEPPEHVKFIFATTEIRKVPVTVLSRCQRFDLRRIEPEVMEKFLRGIADKEGAKIAADALALIIRASEGSARDALSLLDQAIAHSAGETTAEQVRAMLGLADRGRVLDLFDHIMKGEAAEALAELSSQYAQGADPMAVLRDLAEVTHWISVVKISPDAVDDPTISPDERDRGRIMAELPMRALTRLWQMLLKSLEETAIAPNTMMAAEMAIIRMTHIAELPSPEDLVRKLKDATRPASAAPSVGGGAGGPAGATATAAPSLAQYTSFKDVLDLIRQRRDLHLLIEVEKHVRLVNYAPGRIEFAPAADMTPEFVSRFAARLQNWTGARWGISVVSEGGASTIEERRDAHNAGLQEQALAHPLVAAVMSAFSGAEIRNIKADNVFDHANEGIVPIDADELDDEWEPVDPFEENA
ncbi:MAG: DNA polymerase III subunit gamma/tau [Rhodobacteraceae bacterium]|nr:DNA polymerase III subunit gamma/tau [Paracoccaceae bacterium]